MIEKWIVLTYSGVTYDNYEVSNLGNVRNKSTQHVLQPQVDASSRSKNCTSYKYVNIGLGKRRKIKRIILHRAVGESFIDNPNSYKYIIAYDGDYCNVNINNLYWSKYRKGDENALAKKAKKNSNSEQVTAHRKKLKEMSVQYKGGSCCICGYNRCITALEFHHLNPDEKSFAISQEGMTRSWDRVKEELDKCVCVCSNCHKEIHSGYVLLSDYLP